MGGKVGDSGLRLILEVGVPAPHRIRVVFVHGLFSSAKAWDTCIELIESDPELSQLVVPHRFEYKSPYIRLRPDRRIAEIDDLAGRLRTYLLSELGGDEPIVLVTHSQGGIIVQRFLAQTIHRAQAGSLANIRQIVMYACPNNGSQFFLAFRKRVLRWQPQERELRPFDRAIQDTLRTVIQTVINAQGRTETECQIPILAVGGTADNIVPPVVANSFFPMNEIVDGDHFSIIRPNSPDSSSFRILKRALLATVAMAARSAENQADALSEVRGSDSIAPPFGKRDTRLRGRNRLINEIMTSNAASRVNVLCGLPGSGKSRVALEVAFRAHLAGRQVFWVDVTRLNSGMREVANQVGASSSQIELAWLGRGSPTDLVWRALNDYAKPWLLIFDNADEPQSLGQLDGLVSDGTGWLRHPENPNGMVIVTSRNRNAATWGDWMTLHPVALLDATDGADMLLERAGEEAGSNLDARALAEELGGLPLALRAAADYLKSVIGSSVWMGKDAIRSFAQYQAAVKARFSSPPGSSRGGLDESMGLDIVQVVFGLSLDLLTRRGLLEAPPLLKLFACLNIAPIPYAVLLNDEVLADSLLFTEFPVAQRPTVLAGLDDLGLINLEAAGRDELSHLLSMHPVVHGLLRDDADVRERRADYYGLNVRMLLAAARAADPDLPESWALWRLIAPHATEVVTATLLGAEQLGDRNITTAALELTRLTTRYLIATGLMRPASTFLPPIITGCERFGFHAADKEILALRHEHGRMALEGGAPGVAEAQLREVIAQRTSVLGSDHRDTWASRHKLARAILEQQGRWKEAEDLLRSISQAEITISGPDHRDTIVVQHSLARAVLAQGDQNQERAHEAELMLRDILRICTNKWSPQTPELLFVRQSLASSLAKQGKWAEAETEVQTALNDVADRLDSPVAMNLRHTLAIALLGQSGRAADAVTGVEELLRDRERVLGVEHTQTKLTRDLLRRIREDPDLNV